MSAASIAVECFVNGDNGTAGIITCHYTLPLLVNVIDHTFEKQELHAHNVDICVIFLTYISKMKAYIAKGKKNNARGAE